MSARYSVWIAALAIAGCGRGSSFQSSRSGSEQSALVTNNDISENDISENDRGENDRGENDRGENDRGENDRGENDRGENSVDLDDILQSVNIAPIILANGAVVNDAVIVGTTLVGHANGRTYTGADFVGATFTGTMADGSRVNLTTTSHAFEASPNSDLDGFTVLLDSVHHHHHRNHFMCADSPNNPDPAMPVYGYWDYTEGTATGGNKTESGTKFTFACPHGAIGKCINWGFRPWSTYNGVPLAPYHQACTRMTRADYCGDGTPHTIDGSWIEFYDNQGITVDDASWIFEAQWTPDGATCLNPTGIGHHWQRHISCYDRLATSSCAADSPSAMLSTETPYGKRSTRAPPP